MKMFKKIPVFILLFTGYLCNGQEDTSASMISTSGFSPPKGHGAHFENSSPAPEMETYWTGHGAHFENSSPTPEMETYWSGPVPAGRSLPTLVVAGVSIALVLLCILIVAIFWYAWRKSQEGSMELNPIPCSEAGVSPRNVLGPENQQEWPFERAV